MSLEDKIKKAKPTSWVVEGIPKWEVWLIIKWARIKVRWWKWRKRRERGRMKNCSKCKRMTYNVNNFEEKLFKCSRDHSKQFNHPKLHGWFCKHYVNKIIGRSKDV